MPYSLDEGHSSESDILCRLDDIENPGGVVIPPSPLTPPGGLVIIRHGAMVRAFENRCPHFGVGLDAETGSLLFDWEAKHLKCRNHYARFAIDDGSCHSIDCDEAPLTPFPIRVERGAIFPA
ncbi:Rieske (2Fe-2S) protein [Magnetofaba australis]|uniref:Putative Rieske (2Fe-2S) domain-containing protein n=1 Tax=Magnetofaba australis IT-1 TaxID=1434232 RepID=A0A1Y2K6M5_9PROT|nr:Rieske 2Fe-2S domain-containing protein [Magnetofaba australis]OSM04002.1 putative Rieske (2Fe-2S) domain-containing protein [Magnetofaba australis IT-1]